MIGEREGPAEDSGREGPEAGSGAAERAGSNSSPEFVSAETAGAGSPAADPAEGTVRALAPQGTRERADFGPRFHVVVLGSGPVGKTALINALLGRSAGETGATIGTTRSGRLHTHTVEGSRGRSC